MTSNFTTEYQTNLINMLLSDPVAWATCVPQFRAIYFDDSLAAAVRYIVAYEKERGLIPSAEQIRANTNTPVTKFSEPHMHTTALIGDFEAFIRYRAMENVILDGLNHLAHGTVSTWVDNVHEASEVTIGQVEHPYCGLWVDECEAIDPPTFLIRDWLVAGTVTGVYGAPGSFKSYLMLEAAFCLAAGIPFACQQVEQTAVAYIAAEGQRGIAMRLEALAVAHGTRPARNALRLITQPINLLDDEDVSRFIRYLRDLEKRERIDFGLIVLDTYSQCIAGADENTQAVASKASANMIRIRRELSATVVYVHHTGKDASRGMRGSDALRANTDAAMEVTRDDNGGMAATAVVVRSKDAPTGGSLRFRMPFYKVPRLAGRELDGSLVPEFVEEQPITSSTMSGGGRVVPWEEDLLRQMKQGETISVRKALSMTHRSDSQQAKTMVAELLPLGRTVDVRDDAGLVIGQLSRTNSARSNNQYGDIQCLNNMSDETNQSNTP